LKPARPAEAKYNVLPDAWYFAANRQLSMPYAILLEIALQPCGWLAAYVGSALTSEHDLHFRNLGGTATLHGEVFPEKRHTHHSRKADQRLPRRRHGH